MTKLNNFKSYIPEDEDKKDLLSKGVSFLISDEGVDFYESQKAFKEENLKVVCDSSGIVVSYSYDVSSLWPLGKSIHEVSPSDVPKDLDLSGTWVIDRKTSKITKRVYSTDELSSQVNSQVQSKIAEIMSLINPLQFAIDLEMATDEEKSKLKNLQKYVVLLNRVPLQDSYPTGVNWPEIPTT